MNPSLRACASVFLAVTLLDCRPAKPIEAAAAPNVGSAPTAPTAVEPAQTSAPTPTQLRLDDEVFATFFDDDIPRASGGYTYSYGGSTKSQILPSSTPGNRKVFAALFDNDYSGVNISQGNSKFLDLTPYRKSGSLTFWIKGGPGAQKFMIGLMDDQGGERKVQTKVSGDSYAVVSEG